MTDTVLGNPQCQDCVLHRTAQYVCLMGRGRVPAKIMIVGEAPGQREDDVGKPFQGKSGKLLDQMLESIGLDRDSVYITNAVKCRPPENRTPRPAEMKACAPYLDKEIEEVRPKYIVCLGAAALKQVVRRISGKGAKPKITEMHGTPIVHDRVTYYPIYHPAAALRNPKLMMPMQQDWKKFRDVLDGKDLEGKEIPFTLIEREDQVDAMLEAIEQSKRIGYDSETTGLDYHAEDARINTLGIATDTEVFVVPLSHPRSPFRRKLSTRLRIVQAIAEAMRNGYRPKRVAANNGKFDNNWLMTEYGVTFPLNFDNMLAFHLIDENQVTGLKYLAVQHLGAANYDIPLEVKTGKKSDPESTAKLYLYQAKDCKYSYQLPDIARPMLESQDLYRLFKELVMPTARLYEKIERNGLYVYRDRLEEYGEELDESRERSREKLNALARDAGYLGRKLTNWNSPDQINHILFDVCKLEPKGFTPNGKPSTNENLLSLMKEESEIVRTLLEYREAQKMKSTYVDGWLSRMHGNYLYTTFKTNGTITGRPSSEDPNVQATPRNKRLRSCIGAPPGWKFFEADYSQVELRVAAMLSGDEEMARIFLTGGDIHKATASLITGKPEDELTEEERKRAKAVNFGFLYGMGWKKFMEYARVKYDVIVTERQAKDFRRRFFERFYGLPKWHDKQRRIASSVGQVRTLTGRIRHLQDVYSDDKGVAAKAERDAINAPVQGFAAEMTLASAIEVDREFSESELLICGTIHDATIGRVILDDRTEDRMRQIRKIMEAPKLIDRMQIELSVPIITEVKLGDWGVGTKLAA